MVAGDPYDRTVRGLRQAFESGDLFSTAVLLADEVRWHGEGIGRACYTREDVLVALREGLATGAEYKLVDLRLSGDRVLLQLRVTVADAEHGHDAGTIWQALTLNDEGLIVQIQGYSSAAAAEHDLALRSASADAPASAEARVRRLVPFAVVADVACSVAFYGLLGFKVAATFEPHGRLSWASLQSGEAELMVALGSPVDPSTQAVLFYLYSADLVALRDRLVAQGLTPGEIVDGSPGPAQEMRLDDPDGYCLMIAQIDP